MIIVRPTIAFTSHGMAKNGNHSQGSSPLKVGGWVPHSTTPSSSIVNNELILPAGSYKFNMKLATSSAPTYSYFFTITVATPTETLFSSTDWRSGATYTVVDHAVNISSDTSVSLTLDLPSLSNSRTILSGEENTYLLFVPA